MAGRGALQRRWSSARAILGQIRLTGVMSIVLAAALMIMGLWRDEGPIDKQPPLLSDILGWMPWWIWLVLLLAVSLAVLFEGAHREISRLQRGGELAHQAQDEMHKRIREEFEHYYKYGNLLKSMLENSIVQSDELQLAKWRQLALEWEILLKKCAKEYLAPFESQRLWSDAGLTLRDLSGVSDQVNRFHRQMDARMQRLESLIEHEPWK